MIEHLCPKEARANRIACDMEDHVIAARDFARALITIAETMEPFDSSIVGRLAWAIEEHCDQLEMMRQKLRRALHAPPGVG